MEGGPKSPLLESGVVLESCVPESAVLDSAVLESAVLEPHVLDSGFVLESLVLEPLGCLNRMCLNHGVLESRAFEPHVLERQFVYRSPCLGRTFTASTWVSPDVSKLELGRRRMSLSIQSHISEWQTTVLSSCPADTPDAFTKHVEDRV